jgi:hypothetical protein
MASTDDLLNSDSQTWDPILSSDPDRFRRELAAIGADKARSWPIRMKALRILHTRAAVLSAFEAADVIDPLVAMFVKEFPEKKLALITAGIVAEDGASSKDGITLLNLAILFEELSPQKQTNLIAAIERALKGCFLEATLASILTQIRNKRTHQKNSPDSK